MADSGFSTASGGTVIADVLREVVDSIEAAFPGRVRALYVGGSYSDGTAVAGGRSPNASDVDLYVVFRGTVTEAEAAGFGRLMAECQPLSAAMLDAQVYAEDDLLRPIGREPAQMAFLNALITHGAVLAYGEDLRAELPEVPFARYVLDVIESGVFHMGIPRQTEALDYPLMTPLVAPVGYPDAEGELFGYDVVPARPSAPRGTRVLVDIAVWMATLFVAIETGRYAVRKSQSVQLCRELRPQDDWARLAVAIFETCKRERGYAIPEGVEERAQLRDWCRDMLAVENQYLRVCRNYVVEQLRHGGDDARWQAARILRSVVYRDEEVAAALGTLDQTADVGIRQELRKAQKVRALYGR